MTEQLPGGSVLARVWRGWRREIIRGALLFSAVVVIGLSAVRLLGSFGVEWLSLFDLSEDGVRQWEEAFVWSGVLPSGARVFIRNVNGPVTVEAGEGDSVFVVAEKSRRRSNSGGVRVDAVPHPGGMTFCALWEARDGSCGPAGDYHIRDAKRTDVRVRFTVHLPGGIGVDVSTVNGAVEVDGVRAPVVANTVNGKIRAEIRGSPLTARTVNGGIDVELAALPRGARGAIALETVNGSISAAIARGLDAEIDARTVHGRIESGITIVASGPTSPRQLAGRVGRGGPRLTLRTVNGSVTLSEWEDAQPPSPPPAPSPVATPQAGPTR